VSTDIKTNQTSFNKINPDVFNLFCKNRDENKWFVSCRESAWQAWQTLAFPTLKDESWRRTDIRTLSLDSYEFESFGNAGTAQTTAVKSEEIIQKLSSSWGDSAGTLITLDSKPFFRKMASTSPQGVVFDHFENLVKESNPLIEKYYSKAVPVNDSKFSALHYAFESGGALLYIPQDTVVELPFNYFIELSKNKGIDTSHLLVIAGKNSKFSIIRQTESLDEKLDGFHTGVVELFLEEGANVSFVDVQNWNLKSWHIDTHRAFLAKDAHLEWVAVGLGGRLSKTDSNTHLQGEGSRVDMLGLVCSEGKQHLDYHTLQDHDAPNAFSDLLYNTVLKDKSRTVFRGMIKVHPHAQKTDAYQKNNNLSLSSDARADSIPGLEISANDVRCTHGSTTSEIDNDQVLYLMSRGISRQDSDNLIVEGFFETVMQRMQSEYIRERVRGLILNKLGLSSVLS